MITARMASVSKRRDADEHDSQCHVAGLFSRTPRPPPELTALSVTSSMPSESSAAMSFIREIDIASDDAFTRFHTLDGRQRQAGASASCAGRYQGVRARPEVGLK